jgi:hypothetical protein
MRLPEVGSLRSEAVNVVEVAGIEPASESLQLAEPTCVSDSFGFAARRSNRQVRYAASRAYMLIRFV